jgi:hypothetical protein
MLDILADDPTEYESSARCAMITYSVTATNGLHDGEFCLAAEAHSACRERQERDKTGPRSLAAIPAEAIALTPRLAPRFIPYRAAEAAASINRRVTLCPKITWVSPRQPPRSLEAAKLPLANDGSISTHTCHISNGLACQLSGWTFSSGRRLI